MDRPRESIMLRLPEIAKTLLSVVPDHDGPNCWNSTLLFHGVLCKPAYTSDITMYSWLKRATRPLRQGEVPKWGDILVFYDRDYDCGEFTAHALEHTCIFLGGDKYFNKSGYSKNFRWEITTKDKISEMYWYTSSRFHRVIRKVSL